MRNRVKRPTDGARVDVVCPQVARRGAFLLPDPHALNQEILVDGPGTRCDEIRVADGARQAGGEIHGA